jgi:fluoroacetyl-CoA thioesterase
VETPIRAGTSAELVFRVSEADTAAALGSGDVEVLATPRAIAWAEAATCAAVADFLPAGQTTVGTEVQVEHLLPSEVGSVVTATATVARTASRRLTFAVQLVDERDNTLLAGEISRVVVTRERFPRAAAG